MLASWGTDTMNMNLVLGKGELHFDLFAAGTKAGIGERYLGNTPGFTLSADETAIERKATSKGLRHVTDRFIIERKYNGAMVCDQISEANMAMWLGSTSGKTVVAATGGAPVISETMTVYKGLSYQLGQSASPLGQRNLISLVFKLGVTTITQSTNIKLDAAAGRFTVLDAPANITDGAALTIEYKTSGYTRQSAQAPRELKGALRFIADNVAGRNTDYFFPYVSLEPDGAFDFKNSDWQTLQFKIAVLKSFGKQLFYAGSIT